MNVQYKVGKNFAKIRKILLPAKLNSLKKPKSPPTLSANLLRNKEASVILDADVRIHEILKSEGVSISTYHYYHSYILIKII